MAAQLGAAALLGLAKSAAKQAGVPVSKLTKKMIQNMNIPVRFKKLLQGPNTAGETKIAPSIRSSRTVAKQEVKAGGTGFAVGITPTIATSILAAAKNAGKATVNPDRKPMGFASAAKDKQQKSSVKKAVKKAQTKKKVVKPKPRPKKPFPKIKPKKRPS